MSNEEIIVRLSGKVIELEDQLAKFKESSNYWYQEAQKRIPAQPMTMEETVHALTNAEIPRAEDF